MVGLCYLASQPRNYVLRACVYLWLLLVFLVLHARTRKHAPSWSNPDDTSTADSASEGLVPPLYAPNACHFRMHYPQRCVIRFHTNDCREPDDADDAFPVRCACGQLLISAAAARDHLQICGYGYEAHATQTDTQGSAVQTQLLPSQNSQFLDYEVLRRVICRGSLEDVRMQALVADVAIPVTQNLRQPESTAKDTTVEYRPLQVSNLPLFVSIAKSLFLTIAH